MFPTRLIQKPSYVTTLLTSVDHSAAEITCLYSMSPTWLLSFRFSDYNYINDLYLPHACYIPGIHFICLVYDSI